MEKDSLKPILESPYDDASWQRVLREVFGASELLQLPRIIPLPAKDDLAKTAWELGRFETSDRRVVGLYRIDLTDKPQIWRNRVGLRQLLKSILHDVDAALVVFVQNDKWRL